MWYFEEESVQVVCSDAHKNEYSWGSEKYTYHRCVKCGCTTHYTCTEDDGKKVVAINCRMAHISDIADIAIRPLQSVVVKFT